LNDSLKARPVDKLKGFFLPGEEVAGGLFHVLDNLLRVFEGELLLLDRKE